jgi:hypothetical protein
MERQYTAKQPIVNNALLRSLTKPLLRALQDVLARNHREVVYFGNPERAKAATRVREIVTGWETQSMTVPEAYTVRCAVLATAKVEGDIAEVGVFRGGSARVICEAKGDRALHLFDTFEGLPEPGSNDSAFRKGQYQCSLESVQSFLLGFPNLYFYKGYFPGTGGPIKDRSFSFVHLDVDLYKSTLEALQFFYPRMNLGALLISHDYVEFPGVRQAFEEFFDSKPETVIELIGNQCLVCKISPRATTS